MGDEDSGGPTGPHMTRATPLGSHPAASYLPAMRLPLRWAAFLLLVPAPLVAQGSVYVPLDDPRLPLFEHLVRLGDVPDPSPQVRPFRRADAMAALDSGEAHGTLRNPRLAAELRAAWAERSSESHWTVAPERGIQAYTEARRDPLQPGGPDGANPYVELALMATWGAVVAVSPGHRAPPPRRPRLARPQGPQGHRPPRRRLSQRPVEVGPPLLRPDRPQLGPRRLHGDPAQQLRLPPASSRSRWAGPSSA